VTTVQDQRDSRAKHETGPASLSAAAVPVVDLRVVLFTVAEGELLIALRDGHELRLPSNLPLPGQSLDSAARRIVLSMLRRPEQYIEQLYTLSAVDLRERWTIVVSYMALIASNDVPSGSPPPIWLPAHELGSLEVIDRMVADYALVRLRAKLGYTNIAFHLLPETFTLTELQTAYETILSRPLDKRNFRRRVIASGILLETKQKRRDGSHRPAALYRFRADHDPGTYLTPPWAGVVDAETAA